MWENIKEFASTFFVTGDPLIYGAGVSIALTMVAIVFVLTKYKKWGWLWREWLTTVDHKRIGIMYLIASLLMLFRGGVDALLMRVQLAFPNVEFLHSDHYNAIFTTHGTIMILFMAMPMMFGLFNMVVPLQLGARDVAYPFLNAVSFWLFMLGAMLFNLSFVIGALLMQVGCRIRHCLKMISVRVQVRTSGFGVFRSQGLVVWRRGLTSS